MSDSVRMSSSEEPLKEGPTQGETRQPGTKPAMADNIFQALPQEVLIPTELHATYVKAGRRLQNLEHLWRKGGHTRVVWCPRTRAIWRKVLNNPQNHGMYFERIQGWLDDPPARHSAIFALKAAQTRVVKKTEEYQRKVRTARGDRNEKRYNEKKKGR